MNKRRVFLSLIKTAAVFGVFTILNIGSPPVQAAGTLQTSTVVGTINLACQGNMPVANYDFTVSGINFGVDALFVNVEAGISKVTFDPFVTDNGQHTGSLELAAGTTAGTTAGTVLDTIISASIEFSNTPTVIFSSSLTVPDCGVPPVDLCPNIAGYQQVLPLDAVVTISGDCRIILHNIDNTVTLDCQNNVPVVNFSYTITQNSFNLIRIYFGDNSGTFGFQTGPGTVTGSYQPTIVPVAGTISEIRLNVVYINPASEADFYYSRFIVPDCGQATIDLCPNIAGNQSAVPVGMIVDVSGNCVVPPVDLCSNLPGLQDVLTSDLSITTDGICYVNTPSVISTFSLVCSNNTPVVDFSYTITNNGISRLVRITVGDNSAYFGSDSNSGTFVGTWQPPSAIPAGFAVVTIEEYSVLIPGNFARLVNISGHTETLVVPDCAPPPPPPFDSCPNIAGNQPAVPVGMVVNSSGNCIKVPVIDLCPNIPGNQPVVPKGKEINKKGKCEPKKAKRRDND